LKKEEELLYLILEKNLYPNLCGIGKNYFPNLCGIGKNYFPNLCGIGKNYFPNIIATLLQYYLKYIFFCHILAIVEIKAPIIAKLYFSISLFYQLNIK
jgi:hypothetical protein